MSSFKMERSLNFQRPPVSHVFSSRSSFYFEIRPYVACSGFRLTLLPRLTLNSCASCLTFPWVPAHLAQNFFAYISTRAIISTSRALVKRAAVQWFKRDSLCRSTDCCAPDIAGSFVDWHLAIFWVSTWVSESQKSGNDQRLKRLTSLP